MGSIVCSLASVGTKSEETLNGNHKFFSIIECSSSFLNIMVTFLIPVYDNGK